MTAPAGPAGAGRPNVDTYPLDSVWAAMRMAAAAPEDKEATRRAFAATLVRESRELTAGICRRNAEEARTGRRRVTFLRAAAPPSPGRRSEDA